MSTHNICFHGEIRKIFFEKFLLSGAMISYVGCDRQNDVFEAYLDRESLHIHTV